MIDKIKMLYNEVEIYNNSIFIKYVDVLLYILTGIKPINDKKNYEIIKYLLYSNLRPL